MKYPHLSRKLENWLILEFLFIHYKTVKVSQNDQIKMQTWFTSVFLMNGTELRSFSHFQILTWIGSPDLSRNLENCLIVKFVFIHCKTVKVSQDDQIRIWTRFTIVFFMNGSELRSFVIFKFSTKIAKLDLSKNLQIDEFWSLSSFTVKLCKSLKMIKFKCKDDLQVFSWWMKKN